jgi:GT2 family glycosyltransferase
VKKEQILKRNTTSEYTVKGKNLLVDGEIFFVKGVTYGTFAPDEKGYQFPEYQTVNIDFGLMVQNGVNTVRTYTVPPQYVFQLADKYGLKLMVGLPWEQHLTVLDSQKSKRDVIKRIKEMVASCGSYDSILSFAIGNEIPAQIVRWYGKSKTENWLKRLYQAVKEVNPDALVTYVNFPTTEYLNLSFLDFDCFNVYLEEEEKLSKYLAKLHNLSGNKPLVMAEIGLDSMRNGSDKQAEVLKWQVEKVFEHGCAGAFVFSWTDEWWRGGHDILDWDFGLVDRDRMPKPALSVIKSVFDSAPFYIEEFPSISVLVCSYNGSKTIRDTLSGLQNLEYPNFEVVVVNDGSTDNLIEIVEQYPVRLVNTKNQGLSNARNRALLEATGEIVVYLDDDAYPDKYWLHYLATAFNNSNFGGIGGPNIAPPEDGPIADCVANAPGGPIHVLETDVIAEHIPGCNMAFRRDALLSIGGCDGQFRAAGDDVDLCWRLQDKGYKIGFHPSALVWHHRRNSIKTYWKQQQGYGKAEALLAKKWPEKYNSLGHVSWSGRIYGAGATLPIQSKRSKVYFGVWGTAPFQSLYTLSPKMRGVLTLMPEWFFVSGTFAMIGMLGFSWSLLHLFWIPFILSNILLLGQAMVSANKADYTRKPEGWRKTKYWMLTTFLHVIQPISRLYGRIKHGINPFKLKYLSPKGFGDILHYRRSQQHWSELWKPLDEWIRILERSMISHHCKVKRGSEFDRWDLQIRTGVFASVKILMTVEDHADAKQYVKLKKWTKLSSTALISIAILVSIGLVAAVLGKIVVAIALISMSVYLSLKYVDDLMGASLEVQNAFLDLPKGFVEQSSYEDNEKESVEEEVLEEIEEREVIFGNGIWKKRHSNVPAYMSISEFIGINN